MDQLTPTNGLLLLALVTFALWACTATFSKKKVFSTFGLSSMLYNLVSSDLGDSKTERKNLLVNDVCAGMPDAEFKVKAFIFSFLLKKHIVGEYKSRRFRGEVRYNEYYQVMLYIGLARSKYDSSSVSGLLSFKDKVVPISFDKTLYEHLIALGPEFHAANNGWDGKNLIPLHKRRGMRVKLSGCRLVEG